MKERTELQKILVVDDAPINIQVLNEVLKEQYRVFFATDGKDALKVAASILPDIILLDIMMPEMDGYEVCRSLKNDQLLSHIPVIFITAMTQQEDEAVGLELGAVDYISKPFHPSIVRLRIRNQLELKRQRDLLSKLSLLDGLTGIPNRRALEDYLDREWRRAVRNGTELAVIMMDIDHFKSYNDSYGHIPGDECLRKVALALTSALERPADFVARFGGEEFLSILPETDSKGAFMIAERLRMAVDALEIRHQGSDVSEFVSISLGVCSVKPSAEMKKENLLEKADALLYHAKQEGRNRAVSDFSF
jgi:diguanylate cyclase (GGDEF)-like protein